jgi:hypothetical protein
MNTDQPIKDICHAKWQRDLSNLLDWLSTQKGGVATFYEFERRSLALRADNQGHSALLRLLADIAGRFADLFDGEPLEVSTASRALETLTGYMRQAENLKPGQAQAHLELLNQIGLIELAPPN